MGDSRSAAYDDEQDRKKESDRLYYSEKSRLMSEKPWGMYRDALKARYDLQELVNEVPLTKNQRAKIDNCLGIILAYLN